MKPLDYGRSFVIGNGPFNEVRFWLESRTRVTDVATGTHEDYLQTASCKSEDTFAESDLFLEDNYDFLPIFGPEKGVIFRRNAYLNSGYKQILPVADMWNGQKTHLVLGSSCRVLPDPPAILEATYAYEPIVAQNEVRFEDLGKWVVVEYPVKTLNTNRLDLAYQVDTGPVAFPNFNLPGTPTAESICLAYAAFNTGHFVDFILEVPTVLDGRDDGEVRVHHFSERRSYPSTNTLYAVS